MTAPAPPYRELDTARAALARPFPKLEGRRSCNEKENHSAQLGFEFQASRLQNLFVEPGFIDMAAEGRSVVIEEPRTHF